LLYILVPTSYVSTNQRKLKSAECNMNISLDLYCKLNFSYLC